MLDIGKNWVNKQTFQVDYWNKDVYNYDVLSVQYLSIMTKVGNWWEKV